MTFGGMPYDVVIPYRAILAIALPDVTLHLAHPPKPEIKPVLRLVPPMNAAAC